MPVELEIVSPERLLLSRAVDMVVIPAAEGELGVLPQHSPMIVLLRGGVIRLYDGAQVTERLFVSGGFAEVTPTRVTVLADEATPVARTLVTGIPPLTYVAVQVAVKDSVGLGTGSQAVTIPVTK